MDCDAIAVTLWSPAESHANRSLRPDASGPRQMTAGSGQILVTLSRSPSPLGCVLRTLTTLPLWYSTLYRLTWRAMGTRSGRLWYRLVPSARPMSASASSSWPTAAWPTPAACNPNDGETLESFEARRQRLKVKHHNGNGVGMPLSMAVRMTAWPTPRMEGFDAGRHRGKADSLHSAVKGWPTPMAADGERSSEMMMRGNATLLGATRAAAWPTPKTSDANGAREYDGRRGVGLNTVAAWATPIATNARNGGTLRADGTRYPGRASAGLTLTDQTERPPAASWPTPVARDHKGEGRPGQLGNLGKLNPAFVELLQGFPPNWTDIPGPPSRAKSSTPSSRRARSRASAPTVPSD